MVIIGSRVGNINFILGFHCFHLHNYQIFFECFTRMLFGSKLIPNHEKDTPVVTSARTMLILMNIIFSIMNRR